MHYSKENIRGANSCVLIHVIEKGGVRGWSLNRYLKSMVEKAIHISRRITPWDKGTVVERENSFLILLLH